MSLQTSIFNIARNKHPRYNQFFMNWVKWRDAYYGGDIFIRKYLEKFSKREDDIDFKNRKAMTYLPAFAKEAVNEVKNSIFQRMTDISRLGGSKSYQESIVGLSGGVDNEGTDMNTFIGQRVLPELLVMSTCGVFCDMTSDVTPTLAGQTAHPYYYVYQAEDILNWTFTNIANSNELSSVVLRDYHYDRDPETGLPTGDESVRVRHMWLDSNGFVNVQFYDEAGNETDGIKILPIRQIPFEAASISDSLMSEVANYQIALLNLASSELAYTLWANFPFYTEQTRGTDIPSHLKNEDSTDKNSNEIRVGPTVGRRYGYGLDRPDFIHPSSDPLMASMAKQVAMKAEIRELVNLTVANLQPKMASAESKSYDGRSLEAGLSYIGLELQRVERRLAQFWANYEQAKAAEINYPEKYMLKSDEERLTEAAKLSERMNDAPSLSYKKEIAKRIARIMLYGRVTHQKLTQIESEINKATVIITNDWNFLDINLKNGVLSTKGAALAQGFPDSEPDNAAEEHAARLERIQIAQAPSDENPAARGLPDQSGNPSADAEKEKSKAPDKSKSSNPGKGKQ